MEPQEVDFAHTEGAARKRREKAVGLAKYVWDRAISGKELLDLTDGTLRKLARAAGSNPPSTMETWLTVAELLDQKSAWAERHPDHPSASPAHADEKIMWVKPPVAPWTD
ncbi:MULTISPECIES: hypothetical protein [Rhodococcus]|jgi:hypothetical protein|uniref:Uncharacterized protein n=1 Tax=Rhodococcus oxybenzonivorans TaxID=1990687 RepID=A0AAE4V562_9NOCA|nr:MULTISPECIES: hypothetical protein [Rhodococcus]MDV7241431.1 hypothetical protein [Rhodococcus oxybenzonivorans]MDV7267929.1 hypothetical protein [Rhodococcus oxybenzonivorans]MDV7274036.1 hypothetical protein [Rhodococcus oxybenzonivorans]MDV7333712.1 hypothetical protein [Rhodococcus oxybenzonivorans]MDV7343131.1 hypothetical protein [Rhodococcus oxybenzonivorans]